MFWNLWMQKLIGHLNIPLFSTGVFTFCPHLDYVDLLDPVIYVILSVVRYPGTLVATYQTVQKRNDSGIDKSTSCRKESGQRETRYCCSFQHVSLLLMIRIIGVERVQKAPCLNKGVQQLQMDAAWVTWHNVFLTTIHKNTKLHLKISQPNTHFLKA